MRTADLQATLRFLEELNTAPNLDSFAETLSAGLTSVIPADLVAYNEVNPDARRAFILSRPDINRMLPNAQEILAQHLDDNPLVAHHARTGDGQAVRWSDFISQRQLRTTALWTELFRPFAIDHQMVATLPAPRPLLIGVVLHRCGQDFSEDERDLLNMLRPQLVAAYRNAEARTLLEASEAELEERDEAHVLVGPLGEPLAATPQARHLLAVFGEGAFPEQLCLWLAQARSRSPLPPDGIVATRNGLTVEARLLSRSVIRLRAVRMRFDARALATLGLTQREQEVIALVAHGLTNKQIARDIGIEPSTVKKHLERIYDKLGVHTRTAAIARTLDDAKARRLEKHDDWN